MPNFPPMVAPRFRVESGALQYKPFPSYPSWLTAWALPAGAIDDGHFPSTPLLDNFNRDDESPASGWLPVTALPGIPELEVLLQQAGGVANATGLRADVLTAGTVEQWGTIKVMDTQMALGFVTITGDGIFGYQVAYTPGGIVVYRGDGMAFETLLSLAVNCGDGDGVGYRLRDGVLNVFRRAYGETEWVSVGSVADSTYTEAQLFINIGGAGGRWDDVGGGYGTWSAEEVILSIAVAAAQATANMAYLLADQAQALANDGITAAAAAQGTADAAAAAADAAQATADEALAAASGLSAAAKTRAVMWHDESFYSNGTKETLFDTSNSQSYQTFTRSNPAANGNTFTNSFEVASGDYKVNVLAVMGSGYGKIDWYLDDVLVFSGDNWYSATTLYNQVHTFNISGLSAGRHVLKGVVNGKHASSTGYFHAITKIWVSKQSGAE